MLVGIVPAIILAYAWFLTLFVVAESPLDAWSAMKESARLTKGYRGDLFLLCLSFIPLMLLGFLACCLGIFVAQALMFSTLAVVYRFLQAKQGPAA